MHANAPLIKGCESAERVANKAEKVAKQAAKEMEKAAKQVAKETASKGKQTRAGSKRKAVGENNNASKSDLQFIVRYLCLLREVQGMATVQVPQMDP